jgi:hypothetical protein
MKIRTKAPILVDILAGLGFGENMMLTLKIIQFFYANNKQVLMRCCLHN